VKFTQAFFELNFRFAERITEVTGLEFATSLLRYTHLYIRFGLGRSFDPANPVWQAYILGLSQAAEPVMWTYQFYMQRHAQTTRPEASPFGCFSYAVWSNNRIRIHFHNAEDASHRPLSKERMNIRLAELCQMFTDIRRKVPNATSVIGGSWLYHLEAYQRLFPPEFIKTAHLGEDEFPYLALWGQFLAWDGGVKNDMAQSFLNCLQQQITLVGIEGCFPFSVLRVAYAVEAFYEFYQVEHV
jgi:hypothetical protein